jgi:ribosomal-protein-alanine N-acetyltransferase
MSSTTSVMLSLRPTLIADLSILFEFQKDPEYDRMAAFTKQDSSEKQSYLAKWTRLLGDPTITSRTILTDGRIVGSVGIWLMNGEPQVTYGIDRSSWGQGSATAALRLFLEEVRIRPLHASCAFDNAGSMRVLEKCGFQKVGAERAFANARGVEIEEVVFVLR